MLLGDAWPRQIGLSKHRKHKLPAIIKYIEGFDCFWSLLFVSKDQVNPLVQVLRHVLTLL